MDRTANLRVKQRLECRPAGDEVQMVRAVVAMKLSRHRVLTPIAIALLFIGHPPFHRLRVQTCSSLEAFDISRSSYSAVRP
jgi:hypothetical protein